MANKTLGTRQKLVFRGGGTGAQRVRKPAPPVSVRGRTGVGLPGGIGDRAAQVDTGGRQRRTKTTGT